MLQSVHGNSIRIRSGTGQTESEEARPGAVQRDCDKSKSRSAQLQAQEETRAEEQWRRAIVKPRKRRKYGVSRKTEKIVADAHHKALLGMVLELPPKTTFLPAGCEVGSSPIFNDAYMDEYIRKKPKTSP